MKRAVHHMLLGLFVAVVLVSCNNGPTLQTYFVDHQEAPDFISQDLPISMLNMDTSDFTEEQHTAFKSVKRLNFLAYKASDSNTETMKAEMATVKAILKAEKYHDLIEFSDKGNTVSVKYIGTDEEADEIILFGNSKKLGFGIVRILGDDMNPTKMGTLIASMDHADIDLNQLKDIQNFFN